MGLEKTRKLKSHTKSRKGCAQCKSRHKKCDETHPNCKACRSLGLRCSFTELQPRISSGVPDDAPSSRADQQTGHQDVTFSVQDMALLHHFTISTSLTLSKSPSFRKFYQTTIVELGLQNIFLLHSVLSVSALHLSQTSPGIKEKKIYSSAALRHHDQALMQYQEALQDIGPDSWSAVLMSSSLLFVFVFTYTMGDPSDVRGSADDAVEMFNSFRWVRVARGIRVLRTQGQQHLTGGPLWPALGQAFSKWPVYIDPITQRNVYDDDPVCPDEARLRKLASMWEGDQQGSLERAQLYSKHLESLIRAYRRSYARDLQSRGRHVDDGNEQFMQSMGFLAEMTEPFITLLEMHDPVALVLMAHYSKIIDSGSFSFWWTHRNSQVCVSRIRRLLPIEWHEWLALD